MNAPGRPSRRATAAFLALFALVGGAAIVWHVRARTDTARSPAPAEARYVGAEACASCHQQAYTSWRASQHRDAMQPANSASVKGRFDGATFRDEAVMSTFFQRDGRYFVRTDGADGRLVEFEIKYTFGVYPLQQYLIELPRGRIQALSIAWDTRPKSDGGERWFHLYPNQHIRSGDEMHWTGRQQNWNFMCADCHSTNLRKNYDSASDSYKTTWTEINVACEACHGPGSRHVTWAQEAKSSSGSHPTDNGLTVQLTERRRVAWTIDPISQTPTRSVPRGTSWEIDTCARCHSRRSQIADGYYPGAELRDFYEPATIEPTIYQPDGQQLGEVYNYGSFVQSRMAHAGVTCSDCHEPHSAKLRASGNALCLQCHVATRYDVSAHHHHQPASAGATCVECHMAPRTYMEIDARRDHSLRVPRPDLSVSTGVPNACERCHANRPAAWAATAVRNWLGRDGASFQDFATVFHDAELRRPGVVNSLLRLAASSSEPPIVRASAFDRIRDLGAPVLAVAGGLHDADALVRRSALHAFEAAAPIDRMAFVAPLLSDPVRSVRIAAASLLAPSVTQLTPGDRVSFDRAAAELVAAARFNGDRPESRVSLGVFLADQGRTREAEDEYRAAVRLGPDFPPGYVNLADLLRTSAQETDAERVLRDGLTRNPASAELHYALGLSLTRSHRATDAAAELKRASELAPSVSRFAYGYSLALHDGGDNAAAIRTLTAALARRPDDYDLLFALATFERDAGQIAAAREHVARLVEKYPDDREARTFQESLRGRQ